MNIIKFDGDRLVLLALFRLADDSEQQILSYYQSGEVIVAFSEEVAIGHAQIIKTAENGTFELKSIAVLGAWRGTGTGRALIAEVIRYCVSIGGRCIIVSTATADIENLRFYQRQGFRMDRIVRDAFSVSQGYPAGVLIDGIPLRDQVFLSLDI